MLQASKFSFEDPKVKSITSRRSPRRSRSELHDEVAVRIDFAPDPEAPALFLVAPWID